MVVRKDIPHPHISVQAIHAAIASHQAYPAKELKTPNVVLCETENEQSLLDEFERLKAEGVPCCLYSEPDFCGQYTAFATAQLKGKQRKPCRRLKLFKESTDAKVH